MPHTDIEKRRQYAREWVAKRRANWFADKVCVVCGSTKRLELDHVDPSLKESHSIWSWSIARRDLELAKCQVLCHECHQIKSAEYMKRDLIHGSHERGYTRGCRCDACKHGHKIYNRSHR